MKWTFLKCPASNYLNFMLNNLKLCMYIYIYIFKYKPLIHTRTWFLICRCTWWNFLEIQIFFNRVSGVIFMPQVRSMPPVRYLLNLNKNDNIYKAKTELREVASQPDCDIIMVEVVDSHITRVLVSMPVPAHFSDSSEQTLDFCRYFCKILGEFFFYCGDSIYFKNCLYFSVSLFIFIIYIWVKTVPCKTSWISLLTLEYLIFRDDVLKSLKIKRVGIRKSTCGPLEIHKLLCKLPLQ